MKTYTPRKMWDMECRMDATINVLKEYYSEENEETGYE